MAKAEESDSGVSGSVIHSTSDDVGGALVSAGCETACTTGTHLCEKHVKCV